MTERQHSFLERQIRELREGGFSVLLRKIRTFLFLIVPAALTIPIVLLVRALRPFVLIRFGILASERIGHYADSTELYLCERDAGVYGSRTFDIFCHGARYPYTTSRVCNQQLKKMLDRILHVSGIVRFLSIANRWLPGGEKHVIPLESEQDIQGLFAHTEPHIYFTLEEEHRGLDAIRKMGIAENSPFICLYSRDPSYLNTMVPNADWRYHDFRNSSSIYNFLPAIQELANRDYHIVRVGAVVKEALKTNNSKIIDYATRYRTDFMDIFLCARCRFFLGDDSGINVITKVFRRPIVYTNLLPYGIGDLFNTAQKSLFIPKKLWLRREHRFLTFREILESEISGLFGTQEYERQEIDVIENTPEEIAAVAIEMDERLKGTWHTTEEDEQLQRRFWLPYESKGWNYRISVRIGAEFLRQNRKLLE